MPFNFAETQVVSQNNFKVYSKGFSSRGANYTTKVFVSLGSIGLNAFKILKPHPHGNISILLILNSLKFVVNKKYINKKQNNKIITIYLLSN